MDNNQIQQNNTVNTPVNTTTNTAGVNSDILNTQQVDPFSLPKDQMEKDLDLLKKKEVGEDKDNGLNNPTVQEKPNFVPFVKMKITDIDVLKLKNPFKGE